MQHIQGSVFKIEVAKKLTNPPLPIYRVNDLCHGVVSGIQPNQCNSAAYILFKIHMLLSHQGPAIIIAA